MIGNNTPSTCDLLQGTCVLLHGTCTVESAYNIDLYICLSVSQFQKKILFL